MKLIVFSILFWSAAGWCSANPADTVVRNLPFNAARDQEPLSVVPKQKEANAAKERAEAAKKADEILGTPEPSNRAPDDGTADSDDESPGANH